MWVAFVNRRKRDEKRREFQQAHQTQEAEGCLKGKSGGSGGGVGGGMSVEEEIGRSYKKNI